MSEVLADRFLEIVIKILKANKFQLRIPTPDTREVGYDLLISQDDHPPRPVALKYYRTATVQPSFITTAADNLHKVTINDFEHGAILIVSCVIEKPIKTKLEYQSGVTIWGKLELLNMALQIPEVFDELNALDDYSPDSFMGLADRIDFDPDPTFTTSDLVTLGILTDKRIPEKRGKTLCDELHQFVAGRDGDSKEYEKLCLRILKYLFDGQLLKWTEQSRTEDNLNIFDITCLIASKSAFWNFVETRLLSRYVIFECKNYADEIGQGQILTTEKYLLPLAFRKLAIIVCRKGGNSSAKLTVAGAMREAGTLMLILDDKILCEMLHKKDAGEDPSDVLLDLADEFFLKLTR